MTSLINILLLLHPTVVTDAQLVEQIKLKIYQSHNNNNNNNGGTTTTTTGTVNINLNQQIIDRVTKGIIELPYDYYDEIIYINPNNESQYREIPILLMQLIYKLLKSNGKFKGDLPLDQNLDVLMTGFIIEEEEKEKEKEGKESIENTIEDELDGIYLGSDDTNKLKELKPNINGADSKFDLEEFINNLDIKPKKNKRKLLHNKISDNFLEEYGLSSYQELNRNVDDYNSIYEKKQKELLTRNNLNNIPIEKLDGFIIGESSLIDKINTTDKSKNIKKSNIQILTNDEKQKDIDRQKLIEQENFYRQIKNKFNNNDDNVNKLNKLGKILEINNFDNNDVDQLAYLNNKILQNDNSKATTTLDNDLDLLLGISSDGKDDVDKVESNVKQQDDNFDTFINKLTINDKDETFKNEQHQSKLSFDKVNKKQNQNDAKDLDFLDDLLD